MKTKQGIALLLAIAMLMTTTLQGSVVKAQEVKKHTQWRWRLSQPLKQVGLQAKIFVLR